MNSQESNQVTSITRITALCVLLFSFCNSTFSQYPNQDYVEGGIYSLDVPADARGNAMGESFVALQNNSLATMYNPAGLSGFSVSGRDCRKQPGWNSWRGSQKVGTSDLG